MLERSTVLLRAVGCLLALVATGCGGSAALRAAEKGDLEAVRRALPAENSAAIEMSEARNIAHAVLLREIRDARGEAGVQKLRELSSCAEAMDDDLDTRSDKLDEVAAVAGLLRFQARLIDHDELVEHAREALSRQGTPTIWRAVLARGLVTPEHAVERRALFTDNDELVRLAAIQAAFDAFDVSDLEPLLEAGRLDPYPPARLAAIEAAGSIGGERAVFALRDQFVQANEDEQLAIVGAWSSPRSLDAGGRPELVRTAETSRGLWRSQQPPCFCVEAATVPNKAQASSRAPSTQGQRASDFSQFKQRCSTTRGFEKRCSTHKRIPTRTSRSQRSAARLRCTRRKETRLHRRCEPRSSRSFW
jgi:hypothetical protein